MALSIRREHLLARLNRSVTSADPCPYPVLVCAPAGYGKSNLVNDWLSTQTDTQIVRVRCISGSRDSFWQLLLQAFVDAGLAAPCEGEEDAPFEGILHIALRLENRLILAVEDYHLATSIKNDLAILELISPRLSLVLVARRVTVLDGPLASRRMPMIRIGINELAFSREEAAAYSGYLGLEPSTELDNILTLADGWPLAIRAMLGNSATPQPGTTSSRTSGGHQMSPLAALRRFAQYQLESVSPAAQQTVMAATVNDVIDLSQIAGFTNICEEAARAVGDELTELGLLMPAVSGNTDEFSLHPFIYKGLLSRAEHSITADERAWLQRSRADRIRNIAPLAAFEQYIRAEAFYEAEVVLATHFVTITDEGARCLRLLYLLPTEATEQHPTFISARLFLLTPDPTISPEIIWVMLRRWRKALAQTTISETIDPQLKLAYAAQRMVASRVFNDLDQASTLAMELEESVVAHATLQPNEGFGARQRVDSGSYPIYFLEVAATVLGNEDIERAKHIWARLIAHSESLIQQPWYGFPSPSTRTVTDTESGERWRLGALNELALTEALDGNMSRAMLLLDKVDKYTAAANSPSPGLTWVSGEMVRAHLASELRKPELLQQALRAIAPVANRIERWRLMAIAEFETIRFMRGTAWALKNLVVLLAERQATKRTTDAWTTSWNTYHAMLNITLGRFKEANELLDQLPETSPAVILERARLALFSGELVEAGLSLQKLSATPLSKRQQAHYALIETCIAWRTGSRDSAIDSLQSATELMTQFTLTSVLWNAPYVTLEELAAEARTRSLDEVVELIEAVPEPARARQFVQLTEMELQTLTAIQSHTTINATAERMFVTPATVKKHLNSVYRKLGVKNRDQALLQGQLMGIISSPS